MRSSKKVDINLYSAACNFPASQSNNVVEMSLQFVKLLFSFAGTALTEVSRPLLVEAKINADDKPEVLIILKFIYFNVLSL